MSAYYNENDPKAAAWLRELIKDGQLNPEHSRWLMGYPAVWGYGNAIVPADGAAFIGAYRAA